MMILDVIIYKLLIDKSQSLFLLSQLLEVQWLLKILKQKINFLL